MPSTGRATPPIRPKSAPMGSTSTSTRSTPTSGPSARQGSWCGGSSRRTATTRWRSGGSPGSSCGFPLVGRSAATWFAQTTYGYQGASLFARKLRPLRAAMRIAVCRPQVPFAHGGAEIFTDTLVTELRARGHEADLVSVPFKWYPARARADPGVPLAHARSHRGRRRPDRPRDRDEVPLLRGPSSREARLARAPVPPGLRARPHRARPVRRVTRGPRAAPQGAGSRSRRAR